ncbi:MAG: FixH family protein [Campylobacterota bacterium]|nr:FixH family protein [Campylobacterota bacterium]
MANSKETTYWPHMIVGFLLLAFTLSYWTVKSASSMPVQESNSYMLKYQQADIHINEILELKAAFDNEYTIELQDVEEMVVTDNIHSRRLQLNPIKLSKGMNTFSYAVTKKDGIAVEDANVTFLLTRPHSRRDDVVEEDVKSVGGKYVTKALDIIKAGRYTLQLRVTIDDTKIGYSEIGAYLKP